MSATAKFSTLCQVGWLYLNDEEIKLPFANSVLTIHSDYTNTIHLTSRSGFVLIVQQERDRILG